MADWTSNNGIEYPTVDPTGAAGLKLKENFVALSDRALSSVCSGRLTLETEVPISSSDQTAKTSVYFTPYDGSDIGLYNTTDSIWEIKSFSELTLTVPSTLFLPFDVFVYLSGGSPTLEAVDWASSQTTGSITGATDETPIVITSTSHGLSNGDLVGIVGIVGNTAPNGVVWTVANVAADTFELEGSTGNGDWSSGGTWYLVPTDRSTSLAVQDGVQVKDGSEDRRYLGTCSTTDTSGECEDSEAKRFVWNENNRVPRSLLVQETNANWTYTGTSFRSAYDSIANRVELVCGRPVSTLQLVLDTMARTTSASDACSVGIGVDTTSASSATLVTNTVSTTNVPVQAKFVTMPAKGYHYYQWIERVSGGTGTFVSQAGSGAQHRQGGLTGFFEA